MAYSQNLHKEASKIALERLYIAEIALRGIDPSSPKLKALKARYRGLQSAVLALASK
jgi:hypothetical protein